MAPEESNREFGGRLSSLKPRRCRDKDHVRFLIRYRAPYADANPCEAHHLLLAQPRALGRKVSDEFTISLCQIHHRELHSVGNERFWRTR